MSVRRSTVGTPAKRKARSQPRARAQGTDWARLRRLTDDEAHERAQRDSDNPPAPASWLAAGELVEPVRKRAISLRLDPEVIDWFRSTGPKYQSRMNAVLRAFVEHRRLAAEGSKKPVTSGRSRGR